MSEEKKETTEDDFNRYFRDHFNTKLGPKQEREFQHWLDQTKRKYGVDLRGDLTSYDLRGFWAAGGKDDVAFQRREGHAPDTWKKPNHPTFSTESIYNGAPDAYDGGTWQGGQWLSETEFAPSPAMLQTTHPVDWYIPFMKHNGEGVEVLLPEGFPPAQQQLAEQEKR
jgi:hypothetical protein